MRLDVVDMGWMAVVVNHEVPQMTLPLQQHVIPLSVD